MNITTICTDTTFLCFTCMKSLSANTGST